MYRPRSQWSEELFSFKEDFTQSKCILKLSLKSEAMPMIGKGNQYFHFLFTFSVC